MGTTGAMGMSEAVDDGLVSLEQALIWHLTSNHYPPVPTSMVPVCLAAIDAANEDDWDAAIDLPKGVLYRGNETAPAWAIIESHHLGAFLSDDDF